MSDNIPTKINMGTLKWLVQAFILDFMSPIDTVEQ